MTKKSHDALIEAMIECVGDASPSKQRALFDAIAQYRKVMDPRLLTKTRNPFIVQLLDALDKPLNIHSLADARVRA